MPRSPAAIAHDIRREWPQINPYAKPYLDALLQLPSADSTYGADDAKGIILYFLSNASTFRGPKAKELKAELRELVK